MNFSVFLIYNLTKPSSFLVTRKGNRYNDIHLFLSPFFLSFWDSSRFALLSKGGKSFSFFLSTLFLFYLFLIKSLGIYFFFFSVVVKGNKTHTPPHSNRNPSAAGKRTRQSGQKNTWTKNGCRKCKKWQCVYSTTSIYILIIVLLTDAKRVQQILYNFASCGIRNFRSALIFFLF